VVHTGQHYDAPSGGFFRDLGIAPPVLDLVEHAFAVITDSGGLQEETTALGVPCLTVRPNTERPITISEGTNRLVPNPTEIVAELRQVCRPAMMPRPEGWDGSAGERVIAALVSHC
jgi:UDP-N-acetylglucosamine 2-epimerase (non-hydrolysing)